MSLASVIGAGALVGGVAAFAVYAAAAPDPAPGSATPTPSLPPVPTPPVTVLADCTPQDTVVDGVCVTTRPVPTVEDD